MLQHINEINIVASPSHLCNTENEIQLIKSISQYLPVLIANVKDDKFIPEVVRNIFVILLTIVNSGIFMNSRKVDVILMNFNVLPFLL